MLVFNLVAITMDAAVPRAAGSKPLLLLALPNANELDMYREALGFEGFGVHVAETGAEALAKAQALQPDAIVLCERLPPSGEQVCADLKAHPATARIPVVLLTSYRIARSHSNVTLVRPVLPQVLGDTVRGLVDVPDGHTR